MELSCWVQLTTIKSGHLSPNVNDKSCLELSSWVYGCCSNRPELGSGLFYALVLGTGLGCYVRDN